MKPEIGFASQLTTRNILDDLDFAIKNKFDWLEISLDWPQNFDLKISKIKKIKEFAEKNNIRLIVHSPFYLPTSTLLPEIKTGLQAYMQKTVMFASEVGADRITLHPGYNELPGPKRQLSQDSLIENLKRIVKEAKKHKINICLENYDNNPMLHCNDLASHLKVLKSIKGIKATLDVGHANTGKIKPYEYLKAIRPYVMDIHVHDNGGKFDEHICIGDGTIDFVKFFKECRISDYTGPFILELFPHPCIIRGKQRLLKLWEKEKHNNRIKK